MQYDFDHDLHVFRATPYDLRKEKTLAWLKSLMKPLKTIYASFLTQKQLYDLQATFNSQTLKLEWLLNNQFDNVLRRIKIINIDTVGEPITFYLEEEVEGEPVDMYLEEEGEGLLMLLEEELSGLDFQVEIPAELVPNQTAIGKVVDKYKLGGKTYEFVIV